MGQKQQQQKASPQHDATATTGDEILKETSIDSGYQQWHKFSFFFPELGRTRKARLGNLLSGALTMSFSDDL